MRIERSERQAFLKSSTPTMVRPSEERTQVNPAPATKKSLEASASGFFHLQASPAENEALKSFNLQSLAKTLKACSLHMYYTLINTTGSILVSRVTY